MLNCEINTPAMGDRILTAARKHFKQRKNIDVFFEHGQWYCKRTIDDKYGLPNIEETCSVCDAEGPGTIGL
jgi:hypothetical protein